jgi:hypothetical protein
MYKKYMNSGELSTFLLALPHITKQAARSIMLKTHQRALTISSTV